MTAPFGPTLETALRETRQGGKLYCCKGAVVNPRFFCCLGGTSVGVLKDPVAVLYVEPTRGCFDDPPTIVGTTFSADASNSWPPVAGNPILNYEIDWGDGVTTGPIVWPPGGVSVHQYSLPGTYTITLTVTDGVGIGAVGLDTVQVEVLDCVDIPDIEAFCGCGLSGVWHTLNGGRLWEQAGLAGVEIYDLDVSPFTFDIQERQMWAATADGLYKSVDGGTTWGLVNIPLAVGAVVGAVMCSGYDPDETYVLSHDAGAQRVWLHRTADGGATWADTPMFVGQGLTLEQGCGVNGAPMPGQLAWYNDRLYAATGVGFLVRDPALLPAAPWVVVPGPPGMTISAICTGDNYLWAACSNAPNIYRYDGVGWTLTGVGGLLGYNTLVRSSDGTMFASNVAGSWVDVFDAGGTFIILLRDPVPTVGTYPGTIGDKLLSWTPGIANLYEYVGGWATGDFGLAYATISIMSNAEGRFQEWSGAAWIPDSTGHVYKRGYGGTWYQDPLPASVVDSRGVCRSDDATAGQQLFAVLQDTAWRIYEKVGGTWVRRSRSTVNALCAYVDHGDLLFSEANDIYRVNPTLATLLPATGRHHLLSMSGDGEFVYVAVTNVAGNPVILRATFDLSLTSTIYQPGAGTWGGVKADYYNVQRVWIFGNFGAVAANKVQRSEDYGDTWTAVGNAAWGADVIRPVLPDRYDPDDIIAIDNTTLRAWHTKDGGAAAPTWANLGAIAFACHCGERDWIEPQNVFIGRLAGAGNHLQYSPSLGERWLERSVGLTAGAPIVAIVIVG